MRLARVVIVAAVASGCYSLPQCATTLSLGEAKILVLVSPGAHYARSRGARIELSLESYSTDNTVDYYHIDARTFETPQPDSNLLDHYFVNKHTGDVVSLSEEPITSAEMRSIQQILREMHDITDETLDAFGERSPWKAEPKKP